MDERRTDFEYLMIYLRHEDDVVTILDNEWYRYTYLKTNKATEIYDDLKARLEQLEMILKGYGFKLS